MNVPTMSPTACTLCVSGRGLHLGRCRVRRSMMPKRPRPALVTWLDACDAPTEWTNVAKVAATKLVRCQSVGFLLAEDDDRVVLATTLSEDGDAANGIVIPVSCIEELVYLDA